MFARLMRPALAAVPAALGLAAALATLAALPRGVRAAVVAEGTYTITAPEPASVRFRMILTPTGARIVPAQGETLVFSYAKATALVLQPAEKSYFPLPLELVPPLLAQGLGYDPRALGAAASGKTKKLLGLDCGEVVVTGNSPKLTMRSWRVADPAWGAEYAAFERSLGLPWTAASPPAVFVGLPLAGSIEIEGKRPYRASWEITAVTRDEKAAEGFVVPEGYRMDLERLISTQTKGR